MEPAARKHIAGTLLPAVLAACMAGHVAPQQDMWKGRHASDVIAAWGPPQAVLSDRHGGKVLVYIKDKENTTPGQFTTTTIPGSPTDTAGTLSAPITSTTYTPPTTTRYTVITRFSVDSSGVVYEWSSQKQ